MDRQPGLSYADVRYFLEVARVGNISRAADRLGIRQPSVSAAVKRLEKRLQADLLLRSKSGVTLTREGLLFSSKAKAFLAEWETLENSVKRQKEEPAGSFTLGAHVSVALHWLPRQVPQLLKRWPNLELNLVHDLSRKVNDMVINHQIDFGLVVNPVHHPDLVVLELARDVFTFWDRERTPSDTVLYNPDLRQAQTLLQRMEKRGVTFRRKVTSPSLDLIARLAAEGAGTAILPTHLAERTRPALRIPGKDLPTFEDVVCLVYRAGAQRSAGARAIIDALKAVRR